MNIVLSVGHDLLYTGCYNETYNLREHYVAKEICSMVVSINNYYIELTDRMYFRDPTKLYKFGHNLILLETDSETPLFDDRFDSLTYKCDRINKMMKEGVNIDLAVELHFNACKSHEAKGSEVLYISDAGKKYAKVFDKHLDMFNKIKDSRGIKHRSSLLFLKGTKCPAIIIEPLFLDNDEDAKILLSYEGKFKIANSIYMAMLHLTALTY